MFEWRGVELGKVLKVASLCPGLDGRSVQLQLLLKTPLLSSSLGSWGLALPGSETNLNLKGMRNWQGPKLTITPEYQLYNRAEWLPPDVSTWWCCENKFCKPAENLAHLKGELITHCDYVVLQCLQVQSWFKICNRVYQPCHDLCLQRSKASLQADTNNCSNEKFAQPKQKYWCLCKGHENIYWHWQPDTKVYFLQFGLCWFNVM